MEKIKLLKQDRLVQRAMSQIDGYAIIHERPITDLAELMPFMPTDRKVRELFQLVERGVLTYNQVYSPEHFPEGYAHKYALENPLNSGFKLERPADFQKLCIHSVRGFYEALEDGTHLKTLATQVDELALRSRGRDGW